MRKILLTATAVTGLVFAPGTWAQEHGAGGAGSPGGAGPTSESGTSGGAPGAKSPGGAERSMEKGSPKAEGERATPNGGEMRGERGERKAAAPAQEPGERGKAATTNQQLQERGEKAGANTERMQQQERGGKQTTAPGGAAGGGHAAANLSSEQKTKVQSSLKSVNVREANINVTEIRVGGSVPHTVTNYWEPVPTAIVEVVPAWRSFRVVRIRGEILIIDPATFEIVYVIA
jgi:hypothetical protein